MGNMLLTKKINKILIARTRKNKFNPHMTPGPGIEPGTHWWEASTLTTAPSQRPFMQFRAKLCTSTDCCTYLKTQYDRAKRISVTWNFIQFPFHVIWDENLTMITKQQSFCFFGVRNISLPLLRKKK